MELVLFGSIGIFMLKNVDEAWDLLNWLATDTYEFEVSCASSYIPPLASLIISLLCVKFLIILIATVVLVLVIFLMIVWLNCPA